jgi:hypothetical protein
MLRRDDLSMTHRKIIRTTLVAAAAAASLMACDPVSDMVADRCQEDEVFVPAQFDPDPGESQYICVVLDDFADAASIQRLDDIVEARQG